MKKFFATALVIGFVVSASFLRSQAGPPPAATTMTSPESTVPVIPPDQQATKEQVAKLFAAMHTREQINSMMKMFPAMIQQQVRQQEKEMTANQSAGTNLTPEQQAALDKVMNRFLDKAMNLFTVDEMIDDMAAIYQRHFTPRRCERLHRVLFHSRGTASVANYAGHHAGVHADCDAATAGAKQGPDRGTVEGDY